MQLYPTVLWINLSQYRLQYFPLNFLSTTDRLLQGLNKSIFLKYQIISGFFRSAGNTDLSDLGIFQLPKMAGSLKRFKNDLNRLTLLRNCKLHLEVGQRILIKKNRVGTIRYLGHLERSSRKTLVYLGKAYIIYIRGTEIRNFPKNLDPHFF